MDFQLSYDISRLITWHEKYLYAVHVDRYNIHNSCCYMLLILFEVGIVICLFGNGYDNKVTKVVNPIFLCSGGGVSPVYGPFRDERPKAR